LEAVTLVTVVVDAVDPDVIIEDFAVLDPELVVEVRGLVPGSPMGRVIPPCF